MDVTQVVKEYKQSKIHSSPAAVDGEIWGKGSNDVATQGVNRGKRSWTEQERNINVA